MAQMKADFCNRLPANHPLKPPMIEPISFVPADEEVIGEQVGPESANLIVSSSHPTSTTQTSEPSVLENLINHYSGELPGVKSNLERAFEVASSEVTLEIPQQQAPNAQMASTTLPVIYVPEQVDSEHSVHEQIVPKQTLSVHIESPTIPEKVNEPVFTITSKDFNFGDEQVNSTSTVVINSVQISMTNIATNTSTNDRPSSSNLAIQPCAPTKTNVPSPPTIFLDFILLADVCENIFQELNNLIQARNNLVHKDNYERQWKRLKERVDYVLSALQKTCLDA